MLIAERPGVRDPTLEQAAAQAIDLSTTVDGLSDPTLRELVDKVLFEIGLRLADRLHDLKT